MSPNSFLMRFLSACDIDAWVHFGPVPMQHQAAKGVVISVSPWVPSYGVVRALDTAWFQVRRIPLDN